MVQLVLVCQVPVVTTGVPADELETGVLIASPVQVVTVCFAWNVSGIAKLLCILIEGAQATKLTREDGTMAPHKDEEVAYLDVLHLPAGDMAEIAERY